MEVIGFRCNLWRWYRGEEGGIHMNRGRVGEERRGKKMDRCPFTVDVEIESTDTAVKQCTQALINCGATGCFIDIK
jgi:hypothetical protein